MTADYLHLSRRAPGRLATLRRKAAEFNKAPGRTPGVTDNATWRDMRYATYATQENTFNPGKESDGSACWYGHNHPHGARFVWADEVEGVGRSIDHQGWYQDVDGAMGAIRGFIIRWPHGRIQAGYQNLDGGGYTYLYALYDDEEQAAHAADNAARIVAEEEREYRYREAEARTLADDIETGLERVRECWALRNRECFRRLRDEMRDTIATIRERRRILARDYADVEYS